MIVWAYRTFKADFRQTVGNTDFSYTPLECALKDQYKIILQSHINEIV